VQPDEFVWLFAGQKSLPSERVGTNTPQPANAMTEINNIPPDKNFTPTPLVITPSKTCI
jgi:hypothetical protein